MLRFFRKRIARTDMIALLSGCLDKQVDDVTAKDSRGLGPISRSFYVHDYVLGLFCAAVRAKKLSQREARLGFIGYFEKKFGLTRQAAASCFKASQKHYAQNPIGEAFADGLADATAVLSSQKPEQRLRRRFSLQTEMQIAI